MIDKAVGYFLTRFKEIESNRKLKSRNRRIGSELKFPLVTPGGEAVDASVTRALWKFLVNKGWKPLEDPLTAEVIGAIKDGDMNEHRASCETGFCKVEFSLAHTDNLIELDRTVQDLLRLMREFSGVSGTAFLGYGLQPLTPPGKHLLMKKSRNLFWERLFGPDVNLFTINASNQVHIDVTMDEAVDAINVFNGLAGAQIALTANSSVWKGKVDDEYRCAGEMFWDRWLKEKHQTRYGVPERKYLDLEDYFLYILSFSPVYVRRNGVPLALPHCRTFSDFYTCKPPVRCAEKAEGSCGLTPDGEDVHVERQEHDLDQHFTFFWHNARLSRYYTLENRINDQQPPAEILTIPAFTLGIMENLGSAVSLVNEYPWEVLRQTRVQAARHGLDAVVEGIRVSRLSRDALEIAEAGLKKRGMAEEVFLRPLRERLQQGGCPADRAAKVFKDTGSEGFVEAFKI